MIIDVHVPPVGAPHVHVPQVRVSVKPLNHELTRGVPIGQVLLPSSKRHAPAATTVRGTHANPAAQPPPVVGTLQNLFVVLQTGVPRVGVPPGRHVPDGVPVKALARAPVTNSPPDQFGVKHPCVEFSVVTSWPPVLAVHSGAPAV